MDVVCIQDYVMLIPATQFEPTTVLDVQGVDMSSEFIKTCGADHFHLKYEHLSSTCSSVDWHVDVFLLRPSTPCITAIMTMQSTASSSQFTDIR